MVLWEIPGEQESFPRGSGNGLRTKNCRNSESELDEGEEDEEAEVATGTNALVQKKIWGMERSGHGRRASDEGQCDVQ